MIAVEFLGALLGVTIAGGAIAYLVRRVMLDQQRLEAAAEPPTPVSPPLPAYVDPEDDASMDAWQQAQQEIEQAW